MTVDTTASLGVLPRADGSASFTQASTTVIVSVNGPMEVKPRDEVPQEAFIEVLVRPAIGVAGTRERYLESRLLSALRPIILLTHHPRTLIQVSVQIVQAASHTSAALLLPPCLNAASLALVDAAIPLKTVLTATTVVVGNDGEINVAPELRDLRAGQSRHVVAFTKDGDLAFVESEGVFALDGFERAVEAGKQACRLHTAGEDVEMEGAHHRGVGESVMKAMQSRVEADTRWREI